MKLSPRIVLAAVSWLCLTPLALAEGIFPDKNLEAVVRQYVFEKRDNDEPIVEDDVAKISTITGKNRGIKDLTGLEKCRSLALLDLAGNEIEQIDRISGLTNIQSLDLSNNKIGDIGPISGLTKLQYVQLENNKISNLSPLSELTAATSLYLSGNKIKDLSPLAKLTKVWSLYLDGNEVADIAVVAKMKNVDTLALRGNRVKDLRPLRSLTKWKWLFLENNEIVDLKTLLEMGQRDREESPGFSLFWEIHLTGNPLSSEAKTRQLAELRKVAKKVEFKTE